MADINAKYSAIDSNDIQLVSERHLGAKKCSIKNYSLENLNENAAGFISEHAILTVNVNNGGSEEVHSFFLKISAGATVPELGTYIEEIGAFKKEANLFDSLIPSLQQYSTKPWSPKCLLTRKNMIVFENLSSYGFRNGINKNRSILDLQHCKEAISALGRFHASSMIWESKNGLRILDVFGEMLRENTYVAEVTSPRKKWLDVGVRATLDLMQLVPNFTKDNLSKINEKLPGIFLELPNVVKPSSKYPNVLGHGDIWSNNMMFRYENGVPVDCRLVDYQFSRYAPAALDLMDLMHLTTRREFRKHHMKIMIDFYYKVVQEELLAHHLDISKLLPYDEFLAACRYFCRPALVEAILFGHTIVLPEELAVQVLEAPGGYESFVLGDKEAILRKAWYTDKEFREIMMDRLVELAEEYIL